MEISCPACSARYPLAAALTDAAARRALAAAMRFSAASGIGPALAFGYLDVFRPPSRALSWRRAERLLTELAGAAERGSIRRRGRHWTVDGAAWKEALGTVIERRDAGRLETPFRDHAYLWEVIASLANRAEAAEEARAEEVRRKRPGPRGKGPRRAAEVASSALPPVDREAARRGLAAMGGVLGGPPAKVPQ